MRGQVTGDITSVDHAGRFIPVATSKQILITLESKLHLV